MRVVRPSGWSLRARLLAALVGLVAVVCLALGAASTVALQAFLTDRLDAQLVAAGGRSVEAGGPRGGGPAGGGQGPGGLGGARFVLAPGQPAGTLGARVQDGVVTDVGVLTEAGALRAVPDADEVVAAAAAGGVGDGPRTVDVPGLGSYRVLTTTAADGDVLVTGLPLAAVRDTVLRLVGIQVAVSALALVVAGLAAAAIVRRALRPLHRVAAVATRVTALPLARGEVELAPRVPAADTDPRTEVGQVGSALNQLLEHVDAALSARHASETRVRRFVADASHELRTPLAAIRGYAELSRREPAPVPPSVVHALGRVESEALRMTSLVEDLLLLARLDSGRPLADEPVELSRLVVDAVGDASVAARGHRWVLDLPADAVEARGDGARLHQVLANLLANARTHTPDGTTVTARLAATPDGVCLAVVDDGPGIPPALLPHVLERFARGDGSRSRASGSTGLGLSIAHAIVAAHGGTLEVASSPAGTAVTVHLPSVRA